MVAATKHSVVAGHYLATQAAFSILESGGNAVDAGVAAAMALAVLQPDIVSFSGVAPTLVYRKSDRTVHSLAGLGCWPQSTDIERLRSEGGGVVPEGLLRTVMPALPVAAATSANHLAGLIFPPGCRRLYIAADADAAGRHGIRRLSQRAGEAGILTMVLRPQLGDFNDDLRQLGQAHLAAWLGDQLAQEDDHLLVPSG